MFNRTTGAVDPKVIAYWGEHYDIAHRIETNWTMLEPDLRGKIHLFVGTDDTFYLDGAAHRLQSLLDRLHGQAHFTFIPGRTHFDLYQKGDDKYALFDRIAAEMYAVARPDSRSRIKLAVASGLEAVRRMPAVLRSGRVAHRDRVRRGEAQREEESR